MPNIKPWVTTDANRQQLEVRNGQERTEQVPKLLAKPSEDLAENDEANADPYELNLRQCSRSDHLTHRPTGL
jgi:hypothetical protein